MSVSSKRMINCVFTDYIHINDAEQFYKQCFDDNILSMKGIAFGRETCPTTGRIHLQGYACFTREFSMKQIKKMLNNDTLHIEPMRGSIKSNEIYCSKEGQYMKIGTMPVHNGSRTDIEELFNDISISLDKDELIEKNFNKYLKYNKVIDRLYDQKLRKNVGSYRPIEVNVIYGDAGAGKTRYVYETEDDEHIYRLNKLSETMWFDGYNPDKHSVLLIDDFYGNVKFGSFLELIDNRRILLPVKGAMTFSNWDKIYITSNKHPREWYAQCDKPEYKRRFTNIHKFVCDKTKDIDFPMEILHVNGVKTIADVSAVLEEPLLMRQKCECDEVDGNTIHPPQLETFTENVEPNYVDTWIDIFLDEWEINLDNYSSLDSILKIVNREIDAQGINENKHELIVNKIIDMFRYCETYL